MKHTLSSAVKRMPGLERDSTAHLAVIIAAYRAERWIGACLESVRAQKLPPGVRVELRVGVDGCSSTATELERLGEPYWWAAENVGPYVLRNSLVGLGAADAYAIFDADDVMKPLYLTILAQVALPDCIAGSDRQTINEQGRPANSQASPYQHGVCVISAPAWERLGGYQPWRIVADHELIGRATALGISVRPVRRPLYLRRKHPDSLTQNRETGYRSEARQALLAQGRHELWSLGARRIEPVTVPLEARGLVIP